MTVIATALFLLHTTINSKAAPVSIPLQKRIVNSPPRSRVAAVLTGNGSSIPTGGAVWPTGIFWTTVQIGTPPQDFPVAIDSGSGFLDVAGKGCTGCVTHPPNNAYDAAASSTSTRASPYVFSNTYQTCDLKHPTAPCTISGKLYKDKVSLAGLGPVDVKLGAIENQTSNFDQFKEINGVMGFTQGGSENVFSQLVSSGKCDNVWALCMYEGSSGNGTLTIGGVDPRLTDTPVQYVPDNGTYFRSVHVQSLKVGDVDFQVGQSAILDTGTNVLLLPSSLYSQVQKSMCSDASLAHCKDLWSNACVTLTDKEVDAYPAFSMELNGISLEMNSRDYLLLGSPLASSAGQYCLGIRDGGSSGVTAFIIGDTTMRHYYLVFDLARKRIGWGKVNKKTCGSVVGAAPSTHEIIV